MIRYLAAALLACAALATVARADSAADYPSSPVRMLVPFPPGGPTDVVTRIFCDLLSARWGGKPVVVESRPGGGTTIGANAIAKAPPDGLTIGMVVGSFMTNAAVLANLPYDTEKDFTPLGMVAIQPMALVANKDFPANTIPELVALAKKSADPLNYTSPAPRGMANLAGELLQQRAGIRMIHINYSGSAPALTDLVAGRIPLFFDVWHSARRYVESGDLKLIAGIGAERLKDRPDVPTLNEVYPGFDIVASQAIVGPANMPQPIVDKLAADISAVVRSQEFADRTQMLGIEPRAMTPDELRAWMHGEVERWREIATKANIKVE